MSLSSTLSQALRPRVPSSALQQITSESDRVVVENIVLVLAEYIQVLNVPQTIIEVANKTYRVRIPIGEKGAVNIPSGSSSCFMYLSPLVEF